MLPERQLIERLRHLAGHTRNRELIRGLGDDCAILQIPADQQLLVTTDLCIEATHFRREWHPPESVGHRCLTRGLSDIAAMGGEPVACFLSLAVPGALPQKWIDRFLQGLLRLAAQFHVPLAGGDTSSADKITADIVVLGTVPAGKGLLRSGAKTGEGIYVTGALGYAAHVLKRLFAGERIRPARADRHFYPLPRIEVARRLRKGGLASAMIDISDGLSVDLGHICRESRASALLEADAIPMAQAASLELALHGGDEYELLFTAPPRVRIPEKIAGVKITRIGEVMSQVGGHPAMRIRDGSGRVRPLEPKGWQHFA